MKHTLMYYFLILFLFKEAVGKCDVYEQILNGTTNFVTQLWKNLTNSDCQKKCKDNDVSKEEPTSEESTESTQERYNQTLGIECIPRAKAPKVLTAEKSWGTYISQWQYDHCMIASI
ncbi:uncharacterized protein LOC103315671 [Nasonia vitripennis]|uniref:Uncharacterized protein n=1 Tax=Nasonia vitripennis TaxID=7425 RepID=A0A7M7H9J2_NASVI|nr:uncharacterized protein LOC103315671 [Nasonia vitripennis]